MTTVGMIGLGNMGLPMAKNVIAAGYDVIGYRRGDASEFVAAGGKKAASAREVAENAKIIITCIPGDDALRDIVTGPSGIAGGDLTDRVIAELSTLSADVKAEEAEAIAAMGGVMLDGAISGLPPMAAAKKAIFFLSGNETAFVKAKPVLEAMTEKLFFMGEFGSAMKAKLCANMLVAAHIAAAAETLAFGAKIGLDQLALIEALREGAGTSLQFQARAEKMAKGDWDKVLGSTNMLAKDVRLIEAMGTEAGVSMPLLAAAARVYENAIAEGYGNKDVAAVYAAFASASGLTVPNQ